MFSITQCKQEWMCLSEEQYKVVWKITLESIGK